MRIITGSAGSTSDQIARFTAQKLTERLGQQFIVDNRAGAGGTIGTDIAAKAPPGRLHAHDRPRGHARLRGVACSRTCLTTR